MNSLKKMIGRLQAILAILCLSLSTTIGSIPILFLGLLKLIPHRRLKIYCGKKVDQIAVFWSGINNTYLEKLHPAKWEIIGLENFDQKNWYLVVANHQSWLDIVVLQRIFHRKIPVLKFFIKDQLKWIPFLGFSWWAMGCPFMKRYSPEYLAKNPHKKGKDLQATRKALKLFKQSPASLMSFVEGTRYTHQKKIQQNSPYQHLLKPKAGGIGFVIDAMNNQIGHLLDVTIIYPHQHNSLWNFLCQRVDSIKIHIRQLAIPAKFLNSTLIEDEKIQLEFREWLNQKWLEKDQLIAGMQ